MRIIDGLKIKGRPAEIPDCGRDDLPQFCLDMGFKVGAEIGVRRGEFTELFCKAGLKMYAIDPWLTYNDYLGYSDDFHNSTYAEAKARLAPYDCTFIKKYSMDALADFADGSLDFVYIDGNHEFKYLTEDLFGWSKKIKKGGFISGHDYFNSNPRPSDSIHVKYVVDAYTKAYRIKQWYVLGNKHRVDKQKRDKWRSYMWFIK